MLELRARKSTRPSRIERAAQLIHGMIAQKIRFCISDLC